MFPYSEEYTCQVRSFYQNAFRSIVLNSSILEKKKNQIYFYTVY